MKVLNEKGITLVSLAVTIIVLLILAGIAMSTITGDDGIIAKARRAKEQTSAAKETEEGILDDMYAISRQYQGTGREVSDIENGTLPSVVTESSLNEEIEDVQNGWTISFINYDKDVEGDTYVPEKYRELAKNETMTFELKDAYKLYVYACAANTEDDKGNINIVNLDNEAPTELVSYSLPGRKNETPQEPLMVELGAGTYKLTTTYDAYIFKMQFEPIDSASVAGSDEEEEEIKDYSWTPTKNMTFTDTDWLVPDDTTASLFTDGYTATFTDGTSLTNAFKVKSFTIQNITGNYDIKIYMTSNSSSSLTIKLNDSTLNGTELSARKSTSATIISLENQTGTLVFTPSKQSLLYKVEIHVK